MSKTNFFLILVIAEILAIASCQQDQNVLSRKSSQKNYFPQVPYYPQLPQYPQYPQLPQFPQIPQYPQVPQIPSIPQIPQIPSFPQIPQIPSIPQIPKPNYGQMLDSTLDVIRNAQQTLHLPKR